MLRRVSARGLLVAASVALLLGAVTLYVRGAILDPHEFADRATATLEDRQVRQVVSNRIVDQSIEQGSAELIQARPLLEAAVAGALDTGAFQAIFRRASENVHTLLFERDRGSIVLDLADAGIVVVTALKAIAPKLAKEVPRDVEGALIDLSDRQFATELLDVAGRIRFLGIALPLLALILFAASMVVATDRRRNVVEGGIAVAIVAALVVVGLIVARAIVLGNIEDPDSRDAAAAAWDAFFGDLRTLALGAGALGIVFAATAASVIARDEVEDWVVRFRRIVTTQPQTRLWRLARALGIAAISLFAILRPEAAVEVAVVIAGGYGLFFGVGELLQVVAPPRRGGLGSRDIDVDIDMPDISRRAFVIAGVVAIGVVVTAVAIASEDEAPPQVVARPDRQVTVCNGHGELCERPLNQVVFAGTHNSMSAADERGWYLAGHRGGIAAQLDYGVRALLIDTHYGIRDGEGNVRTDLEREGTNRAKIVEAVGEDGVAAAERLVGRVGFGALEGDVGIYMCHVLCELGATPLADGLTAIRTFLDEHPDEFVILFIQDAVSAPDTAAMFDRAGLTRYAYSHARTEPWPSLGELIGADRRLLVLAEENARDGPAWYHEGFDLTQETPYRFNSLAALGRPESCRRNRGSAYSPLFLMNHWIERPNPSPSLAAKANDRDLLVRRARRCARARSLLPTIVAVDFYDEGGLLGAVDELNRVSAR
ncbi:MAG TPA: hypothetical protein VD790_03965 [Thermoleophilaceae bacterium]|nr:hypothetical protein [Thermoleophilaceae bacterium]